MSSAYFQKWEPCVQREVQKLCALCGKDFSFVRREHQCKRCLRAVCSDCSGNKITVYKQGLERKAHRGCKICAQQQRENTQLIEANRLQFARMSPLGTKWLAKLQKKGLSASIDNRKHKKFTRQVFARMWDSYNYSLREFIGMLTADLDQDEIYRNVNDVVATVVSTVPQEDLESVAYLAIFLLCFCSPDKAPFICLHLLELKASVTNYEGLLQAYLKAVGVGEGAQEKLKDYQRFRVRRFIGTLSVNSVSAKTSLEVLQRILSKKRIDELYTQLALSLQMLRDSILARKDNLPYCDLLMVRLCTLQATSSKGKLPDISAVKCASFMRERNDYEQEQRESFMRSESSMMRGEKEKQAMAASFSEGIRGKDNRTIIQSPPNNPEPQHYRQAPSMAFKKRMDLREDSFIEDSFSVISMIDEMNQVSDKNGREIIGESNQLLQLMNQQKFNDSMQIKRQVYGMGEKTVRFPQLNLSLGEAVVESIKNKRPIQCEKCISTNRAWSAAMRELQQVKQQKQRLEENFKRQFISLHDRLKSSSTKENQSSSLEKLQYQLQIRKLKQTVMEYEHRDRQAQSSLVRTQQLKKQVVRLQLQLKAVNHQLSESATTTKMLRNKLEMQSLSIPQGRPTEATDALKVNEILKKSLFEKNQQIQELSKKNKLIQYQIEEMSKERMQDKERAELRQRTGKLEKEKEDLLVKMKELSNLLMEMQSQKLNLSEQVFDLKQALRDKGVVFSRS